MTSRLIALAAAVAAVGTLAACGSTGTTASPTTSTVVVTTVVTAPPSSTEAPPTADPTTDDVATDTPTVERGTEASAYVGHYQRHESTLDLLADQTGRLLQGASAVDVETWAITWRPAAQGITITYERLLKKYGKGLEAGLVPGIVLDADFATGETGNQVLTVSGTSPRAYTSTWCLPGRPSPECGA